jgi:hypothetical protein
VEKFVSVVMAVEVQERHAAKAQGMLKMSAVLLRESIAGAGVDGPRQLDRVDASVLRGLFASHGDYPAEERQHEIRTWRLARWLADPTTSTPAEDATAVSAELLAAVIRDRQGAVSAP